jgi:hypothetical protein
MLSSIIKENSSRNGTDIERTKHYLWFLLNHLRGHMVHPPSVRERLVHLLLIIVLALRGLLVLPFWVVVGEMSLIAIDIALVGGVWSTIL